MQPFTERVIRILKRVPPGHVVTYGQVAAAAGSPRAARQVVRILHSMSAAYDLPWHRVVNAQGAIAVRDGESRYVQRADLEQEGVSVDDRDCVDLTRYGYSLELDP